MKEIEIDRSNEEQLLSECGRGNKKSFEMLYKLISGRMLGFATRFLGSFRMAEEAFQEIMIRLWVKAPLFNPQKGSAKTWIYRLAGNVMLNFIESKKRISKIEEPADSTHPAFLSAQAPESQNQGAIERFETTEKFLSNLPEDQRMAVLLRHVEGFSIEEIASVLECPEGTAKSKIFHGLKKLRSEIEKEKTNEKAAEM
ncbi:MAG: RNA polymerase sigma factor [Candidatus Riflebacteria bacterium]|nr:RNA polymerase sigma factor [Candidatus Riflebacteria bacterium]